MRDIMTAKVDAYLKQWQKVQELQNQIFYETAALNECAKSIESEFGSHHECGYHVLAGASGSLIALLDWENEKQPLKIIVPESR